MGSARRRLRYAVAAGALALAAAVTAGGQAGAVTTLKGGGADSADPLIGEWQKTLAAAPYSTPVDYSADGTGMGRAEFVDDNVDFTVTNVPFTAEEQAALTEKQKTFTYIPFTGGSIAFLYQLKNAQGQPIRGLQFSGETLTKIFTGTVTDWNAAEIQADNPGVELPAKKITPTVRGQADGATYTATSFFRASAPAVWKAFMEDPQRNYPDEARELYPFFAGSDSRTSSFAIGDIVGATEGGDTRITYLDTAWALEPLANGADIAKVKNAAGKYVLPSAGNAQAALAEWDTDASTHLLTPDYAVTPQSAYPVVMVNYLVVRTSGLAAETAASLSTFARYGLGAGQAVAPTIGDPALPEPVVTAATATLDEALPVTDPTTTTTTAPPAGSATDVSGSDLSSSSGSSDDQLAYTGGPALAVLVPLGAGLGLAGTWIRRHASR